MALLSTDTNKFLLEVLEAHDRTHDDIVANWNDEVAEVCHHEGHVLLIGKVGCQKIMHCITHETIDLPGVVYYMCGADFGCVMVW